MSSYYIPGDTVPTTGLYLLLGDKTDEGRIIEGVFEATFVLPNQRRSVPLGYRHLRADDEFPSLGQTNERWFLAPCSYSLS